MLPPSTEKPNDATSDETASLPQGEPGVAETGNYLGDRSAAPGKGDSSKQFEFSTELQSAFGDRYQLGPQLGEGGFGAVFQAHDKQLNRAVAIKVSRGSTTDPDRLLREARSLAQLRHTGIITVYDVAVTGSCCFVVSELLPGPSLAAWLEGRRLTPVEAVQIVVTVADALAHAHSRSIVHRDVKPANIVFAEDQRPVLVDFGLALSDLDVATERGVVAGTPAFMSPEQASGRGHRPDGRTDIYGLAVTLYAMLGGRSPFRGRNYTEILRQVREDEPQPLRQIRPDVPLELEQACMKGMAKLSADRYTTATDFADALRRAVRLLPALPPPVHPPPISPPPPVVPQMVAPVNVVGRTPRTERRQISLLQCAFEATGEDDPMEQVIAFQEMCAEVVQAHGGMPLQAAGTAFLACFGYPVAREDTPRQAVRAALEICQKTTPSQVVAVGTGAAVVTEQPPTAPVVVGDVVTVISAILSQGTAAGVMVADKTFQLVEGFFDCEPSGAVNPRGISPVVVYSVKAQLSVRNRIEAANPARLSPLVGRDREVDLLKERWELTSEGVQNVILLVADPGLGKSRLVRVLRDHVLQVPESSPGQPSSTRLVTNATMIEWYCSPYHQGSPFYPVIEYFDRVYRLSRELDPAQRLELLITRLRDDGVYEAEDLALFAAMLSVPAGDRLPALALNPERQREKTQEALLNWLNVRAEHSPVLFVVEDLHWVDPSTESLLGHFVERGGESRVLAVFTFRPEYDPPWKGKAVQTQVALNRLTRSQVGEMIRAQTSAAPPQNVIDQIVERTDGVPLFVEEFTRLLTERGPTASVIGADIPTTLHDLLLARLDRMASDKEVVQLAAVIGRTFSYAVIRATSELDEATLQAELEKLIGAGLLFVKGTPPRSTYTFKHALIQDAAYQSMVKKRRQRFHRIVAERLEERFPEVAATQPELLARHFTEGAEASRAIDYWLKAGQRARERSAYREAIQHFGCGLELVATLPESINRDRAELQFQIPLSTATTMACGWGYPGLQAIYVRARELCDRIGSDAPTFAATWGQWAWRLLRAELDIANTLVADLENQAAALDDGYAMEACFALSCTTLFRGDFERNLAQSPRGLVLHDPERCAVHARYTGQNAFCTISAFYSWTLAICGYPDRAVRIAEESLHVSRTTRDKYSEEFALYHLGCINQHFRLGSPARACGENVVAVGTEHGFASWVALGTLCQGAGMVIEGRDIPAGLELIDAGIRNYKTTGAELGLSNYLAISVEGYRKIDRIDKAWATLEDAFAMVERTAERFQLSNLHRIRGDLLLDRDAAGAESEYLRAINVARDQKARSWELRALLRLCRLWSVQQRQDEAHANLSAIYAEFTEGLELPDLQETRTLLADLSR